MIEREGCKNRKKERIREISIKCIRQILTLSFQFIVNKMKQRKIKSISRQKDIACCAILNCSQEQNFCYVLFIVFSKTVNVLRQEIELNVSQSKSI